MSDTQELTWAEQVRAALLEARPALLELSRVNTAGPDRARLVALTEVQASYIIHLLEIDQRALSKSRDMLLEMGEDAAAKPAEALLAIIDGALNACRQALGRREVSND